MSVTQIREQTETLGVMMFAKDFKQAANYESSTLGVRIMVTGTDGASDKEQSEISNVCSELYRSILCIRAAHDQEDIDKGRQMVADLLLCFDGCVYSESIPNEYCGPNDPWGINQPWLIVTTRVGRIKIGWRKRVIQIDWSGSEIKTRADDLFPDENVTKDGRLIHAWSYDDAKRYISKIVAKQHAPRTEDVTHAT